MDFYACVDTFFVVGRALPNVIWIHYLLYKRHVRIFFHVGTTAKKNKNLRALSERRVRSGSGKHCGSILGPISEAAGTKN